MNWITAIVAVYGALLSTVAIVWQIAAWRERVVGRVKVFVRDNMMTYSKLDGEEGPFILFEAVNDGEKPVRLNTLGVTVKGAKKSLYVKCEHLPRNLCEGEEVTQLSDRAGMVEALRGLGISPPWQCTAVFYSSTKREYKKKFKLKP